jgi:hypothetical protein
LKNPGGRESGKKGLASGVAARRCNKRHSRPEWQGVNDEARKISLFEPAFGARKFSKASTVSAHGRPPASRAAYRLALK